MIRDACILLHTLAPASAIGTQFKPFSRPNLSADPFKGLTR